MSPHIEAAPLTQVGLVIILLQLGLQQVACQIKEPCVSTDPSVIKDASSWTSWLDRDNPSGKGDFEELTNHQKNSPVCSGGDVLTAECRVKGETTTFRNQFLYRGYILYYDCDKKGLVCRNADQCQKSCADFEIKFYCEGVQFSTPIVQHSIGSTNVNLMCQVDVIEWIKIEILHSSSQYAKSHNLATIRKHECPIVSQRYSSRVSVTTGSFKVEEITNGRTLVTIHFAVLKSADAGVFTCRVMAGLDKKFLYEGQLTMNLI